MITGCTSENITAAESDASSISVHAKDIFSDETEPESETVLLTSNDTTGKSVTGNRTSQNQNTNGIKPSAKPDNTKPTEKKSEPATRKQIVESNVVYITPSGKKYHLSATCGGKNSYAVSIDEIGSREPCKKCAQ